MGVTEYQGAQFWIAMVLLLAAVPVVGFLVVIRRRAVAPLVVFAAVVLVARAGGFVGSYFGSAPGETPPVVQVVIDLVRAVPGYVFVGYVCAMQARRYRTARSNDVLRAVLRWGPYALLVAFFGSLVGELALQTPVFDISTPLPRASFFVGNPLRNAVLAFYSALVCYVFLTAVRPGSGPLAVGQRLQNLFFGIASAGASGLSAWVVYRRAIRTFVPEDPTFLTLRPFEYVTTVLFAGGLALGIISYYTTSKRGRFMERFSAFLDLVGDLVEELASAPIDRGRYKYPYAAMHQAAGAEFLELSAGDVWRADNAFCARVVWEERSREGGRISRRRLRDLARAYDGELAEPVLAEGLSNAAGKNAFLPERLVEVVPGGGLGEALRVALRAGEEGAWKPATFSRAPRWEQLVGVALADAGLLVLGSHGKEQALEELGVSPEVLDAYRLASYKARTFGEGPPDVHDR